MKMKCNYLIILISEMSHSFAVAPSCKNNNKNIELCVMGGGKLCIHGHITQIFEEEFQKIFADKQSSYS